jgi:hypothetical protein
VHCWGQLSFYQIGFVQPRQLGQNCCGFVQYRKWLGVELVGHHQMSVDLWKGKPARMKKREQRAKAAVDAEERPVAMSPPKMSEVIWGMGWNQFLVAQILPNLYFFLISDNWFTGFGLFVR